MTLRIMFMLSLLFIAACDTDYSVVEELSPKKVKQLISTDTSYISIIEDISERNKLHHNDALYLGLFSDLTYSDYHAFVQHFKDSLTISTFKDSTEYIFINEVNTALIPHRAEIDSLYREYKAILPFSDGDNAVKIEFSSLDTKHDDISFRVIPVLGSVSKVKFFVYLHNAGNESHLLYDIFVLDRTIIQPTVFTWTLSDKFKRKVQNRSLSEIKTIYTFKISVVYAEADDEIYSSSRINGNLDIFKYWISQDSLRTKDYSQLLAKKYNIKTHSKKNIYDSILSASKEKYNWLAFKYENYKKHN